MFFFIHLFNPLLCEMIKSFFDRTSTNFGRVPVRYACSVAFTLVTAFGLNGQVAYKGKVVEARPVADAAFRGQFVEVSTGLTPPQPLNLSEVKERMHYPLQAQEAGIQGKVVVRVLVSAQGKYVRHVVLSSSHALLVHAADAAITQLECTPGKYGLRPTAAWLTIPFDFKLR